MNLRGGSVSLSESPYPVSIINTRYDPPHPLSLQVEEEAEKQEQRSRCRSREAGAGAEQQV